MPEWPREKQNDDYRFRVLVDVVNTNAYRMSDVAHAVEQLIARVAELETRLSVTQSYVREIRSERPDGSGTPERGASGS